MSVELVKYTHPLREEREVSKIEVRPGARIEEYLPPLRPGEMVVYNGRALRPKEVIVPGDGDQIMIRPVPAGGFFRAIAMIALVVIAFAIPFLSPALIPLAMVAEVALAGALLISGLIARPKAAELPAAENAYSWAGPQMTVGQGYPIARGYGKLRLAPQVIGSYRRADAKQNWLRIQGSFGFGPARSISDLQINEQPLSNYSGISTEQRLGFERQSALSYFGDIVNDYPEATQLHTGVSHVYEGHRDDTQALEIEVNFPRGIMYVHKEDFLAMEITYTVEYKLHSEPDASYKCVPSPRTTSEIDPAALWIAVDRSAAGQFAPAPGGGTGTGIGRGTPVWKWDLLTHYEGEPYEDDVEVPLYDDAGNYLGTQTLHVVGVWTQNNNGTQGTPVTVDTWHASTRKFTVPATQNAVRDVVRIDNLPPGKYDLRITKVGANAPGKPPVNGENDMHSTEEMWLEAIREINYEDHAYPDLILLGVDALATDQLSGSNVNLTALVDFGEPATLGYKHTVAFDAPDLYLRLGELIGTTAADSSGYGKNGEYHGGIILGQPGLIHLSPSKSCYLDGVDDYISLASTVTLDGTNGAGGDVWIRPEAASGWIFRNAAATVGVRFDPLGSGKLSFVYDGADHLTTLPALALNRVHHVALCCGLGYAHLLVDGQIDAGYMPTPTITVDLLGDGFRGRMCDFSVANNVRLASRYRAHYEMGVSAINLLEPYAGDNPACVALDLLTNRLYGAGISPSLIDVYAFQEWADFCNEAVDDGSGGTEARFIFNGVFDTETNVWDAIAQVGAMSRACVVRTGTKYTVVLDRADDPVQIFNVARIVEKSFKQTWLSTSERANTVQGDFLDESDPLYTKTPIEVTLESAIENGDDPNPAGTVSLLGVTSATQAFRQLDFLLKSTAKLDTTYEFEAAAEAVNCRVGNVIGIQHDLVVGPVGGLTGGADGVNVTLDRDVTMIAGHSYVLQALLPAVDRYSGAITAIDGDLLTVAGWDGVAAVKRCKVGDVDQKILSYGAGYVQVEDGSAYAVGQTAHLWDVNVLEKRDVITVAGTGREIAVVAPFSAAPVKFTAYTFGETTKAMKLGRVVKMSKSGDLDFAITAVKYDETLYDEVTPSSSEAGVVPDAAVTRLGIKEEYTQVQTGGVYRPTLLVTWEPGRLTYGATVIASDPVYGERVIGSFDRAYMVRIAVEASMTVTITVIGYDSRHRPAPRATAPSGTVTVVGPTTIPDDVANFHATAWASPNITLAWNANDDADLAGYEIRYSPMMSGATWEAATQVAYVAAPAVTKDLSNGAGTYLIKALDTGGNYSNAATGILAGVSADTIDESGGRKWAGESGATIGAAAGINLWKFDRSGTLSELDIITARGTAADTAAVAGTAAGTVSLGAVRAFNNIQASGLYNPTNYLNSATRSEAGNNCDATAAQGSNGDTGWVDGAAWTLTLPAGVVKYKGSLTVAKVSGLSSMWTIHGRIVVNGVASGEINITDPTTSYTANVEVVNPTTGVPIIVKVQVRAENFDSAALNSRARFVRITQTQEGSGNIE